MDHLVTAGLLASPLRPYDPDSLPDGVFGTAENPMIPKKRRRTSPAELAILEQEFLRNPLPSQIERAAIATRVNMSGRALQVWFQNRRQKEKKDAHSYPSSVGSAPDPDVHASDFDHLSTTSSSVVSSSPARPRSFGFDSAPHMRQTGDVVPLPASPSFLAPSHTLYATTPTSLPPPLASDLPLPTKDKENDSFSRDTASDSTPTLVLPADECESKPTVTRSSTRSHASSTASASDASAHAEVDGVYVHRPSTTTLIAAKKHVKKRPLGTNAPLARTPALPHAFAFPPSPRRGAPSKLKEKDANVSKRENVEGLAAAFAPAPTALKRRSSAMITNDSGRAWLGDDLLAVQRNSEVWQHMESDPPSAHSPVPLTRRRMRDLVAGMDSSPQQPPVASYTAPRPNLTRSVSLGGASTGSFTAALERSRAGGQEACAELALERKRLRMDPQQPAATTRAKVARAKPKTKSTASTRHTTRKSRRATSSASPSDVSESSFSSMADLSYSSTSTAVEAVEAGTPSGEASHAGYFTRKAVKVVDLDNEGECAARLLLGLGGFV